MLKSEFEAGLSTLDRSERMRLMKFVCSFAWADLEVQPEERSFVADMVRRLEFNGGEARQVDAWLDLPPEPEAVDPTAVPPEHRRLFLEAIEEMIEADGEASPEERASLALFKHLLP